MKNEVLILVTNIPSFEGEKSFYLREQEIKEEMKNEKLRFFHSGFQSKTGTLSRILKEECSSKIHVVFHMNIPPKKVEKIIDHVIGQAGFEKVVFSTRLN